MTTRLLTPNERMTDAFDRASTLNFTTVARVLGDTTPEALASALRKLERRHPLLRAGLERAGKRSRFLADAAAPIPLTVLEAPHEQALRLAEDSLRHQDWPSDGPRAQLTYVRHGSGDFSLLLCLHHVVSDGSSGILAMRDLLSFLGGAPHSDRALPSPGVSAFVPRSHGGLVGLARALVMLGRSFTQKPPRRLHVKSALPFSSRRPRVHRLVFSRESSLELARRARAGGATVHGVLCAGIALAVAEQLGPTVSPLRVMHPVCLRRYRRTLAPEAEGPGEAVGCYVSSVETNHLVDGTSELPALARQISSAVQERKRLGIPLLTAPIAGPLFTDLFARKSPEVLRTVAENKAILNTFSLTNLGRLEQLRVDEQLGTLRLHDLYFVAAGSVLGALGGSATSFGDRLSLQIAGVEPLLSAEALATLAQRVHLLLLQYAAG